jgi:hypothetical protein
MPPEGQLLWMVKLFEVLQSNLVLTKIVAGFSLKELEGQKKEKDHDQRLMGTMMAIVLYLAWLRELGKSNYPIVPAVFGAKKKLKPKKRSIQTVVVYENNKSECAIITP